MQREMILEYNVYDLLTKKHGQICATRALMATRAHCSGAAGCAAESDP